MNNCIVVALLAIMLSLGALNDAHAGAPACPTSSVSVTHTRYSYTDGFATVTGIVTQTCGSAVGVHLKFTAYYADGSVAFTDDFWPNSTSNIPSGTRFPFEDQQQTAIAPVRYSIMVLGTETW